LKKLKDAKREITTTKVAFDELDSNVDKKSRAQWLADEEKASLERGDNLLVYEVKMEKGMSVLKLEDYHTLTQVKKLLPWQRSD
jgi:hypothetical protein